MPRKRPQADEARRRELDDAALIIRSLLRQAESLPLPTVRRKYLSGYRMRMGPVNITELANLPALMIRKGAPIRVGGGGVVIQCVNRDLPDVRYALKIVRPSLYFETAEREALAEQHKNAVGEYHKHGLLSHQNVARVFGGQLVDVVIDPEVGEIRRLPAFLMEWLADPIPLNDFLLDSVLDYEQAIGIVAQAFKGLAHIHGMGLIHWDLKSDNILVDRNGLVKIVDLGNSRSISNLDRGRIAYSTRRNLPPALRSLSARSDGTTRRTPVPLDSLEWDSAWLDLWMLARELNQVLRADERFVSPENKGGVRESKAQDLLARVFELSGDDGRMVMAGLRLILRRLLRPVRPEEARFYESADEVVSDLGKLTPEFGAAQSVPELRAVPQSVMRLPVSGNFPYSSRLGRLFNSAALQRLNRHLQLGMLSQVYPGATHRRSEHVAGVTATAIEFVRALYSDRSSPFWRLATESRDIEALIFAAMVHDLGHVAFGHFVEEMRGLLQGRMHEDYVQRVLGPVRRRGGSVLDEETTAERLELLELVKRDWARDAAGAEKFLADVGAILRGEESSEALAPDGELVKELALKIKVQILHSILNSSIDADKLDYLMRDSHHAGVKYAEGIDCDRFFQSLTTVAELSEPAIALASQSWSGGGETMAGIGISEKGILPVESILMARYQLFASVYWHHTARGATAMLQYLVQEYVASAGKEELRVARLEELLREFRRRTDLEALEWIEAEFESETRLEAPRRKLLSDICRGLLGERELLYWPVFELRYERTGRAERETPAQRLFDTLREASDRLGRSRSIAGFLKDVKSLRRQLSSRLAEELSECCGQRLKFDDGEVLLDIPPAGMDQVGNIFVVGSRGTKPIQDLSPVVDAIGEIFRYWARKIRIFMAPGAAERCESLGITSKVLHEASWDTLQWIIRRTDPQLYLFGDGRRRTSGSSVSRH